MQLPGAIKSPAGEHRLSTTESIGAWLQGVLGQFGVSGQLAILFIIFFIDAVLFPMLPEAFVVLFYNNIPTVETRFSPNTDIVLTAALVLLVVLAAELAANGFLYTLAKRYRHRIPQRLDRAMNRWREFLVVSDERVILLNRVVPVMPFTGAFIAVSPWVPQRAFGYLLLGGSVKYGLLIAIVAVAGLIFDPRQTWWVSIGLIVAVLALSMASHGWARRRMGLPPLHREPLPPPLERERR